MSRRNYSSRGSEDDSRDALERDLKRVQKDFPPNCSGVSLSPFDPVSALSCARQLAKVKSEDEALGLTMILVRDYQAFLMAVHFAYPYLSMSEGTSPAGFEIPYVSLAKAVESFLTELEPKLVRQPS